MLKGTDAKLAWHASEVEAWLGTSLRGFVKWNKESAGQWKVLGLLRKQWFFQHRLGAAVRTFCRKDGGRWGQGGWGEGTRWKVESPGRPSRFERQECELVQSIQDKTTCPWGGLCDPWCVAARVTSLLIDSSLLRLMNGWVFSARIQSRICQLEAGV